MNTVISYVVVRFRQVSIQCFGVKEHSDPSVKTNVLQSMLTYPAVCTVDKGPFGQKGLQETSQILRQGCHLEDLSDSSCQVYHSLVGEAHVEGPVAPL